jgi:hypothetical protein
MGGVKSIRPDHGGQNKNEISFARFGLATMCPGSPGLWPRSFTFELWNLDFGTYSFQLVNDFIYMIKSFGFQ